MWSIDNQFIKSMPGLSLPHDKPQTRLLPFSPPASKRGVDTFSLQWWTSRTPTRMTQSFCRRWSSGRTARTRTGTVRRTRTPRNWRRCRVSIYSFTPVSDLPDIQVTLHLQTFHWPILCMFPQKKKLHLLLKGNLNVATLWISHSLQRRDQRPHGKMFCWRKSCFLS